jgi:DNA-binding MarR family transcriptional regulator
MAGSTTDDGRPTRRDRPLLTDIEEAAWRGLLCTRASVLSTLDRELELAERLTVSGYEVLLWLARATPARLRMKDLADSLLMSPSGLTRVVAELERRGAVIRSRCADDGRGVEVELTDVGRSTFRRARQTAIGVLRGWFLDHLGDVQVRALADIWHAVGAKPESP